jgi:hypothetical protein
MDRPESKPEVFFKGDFNAEGAASSRDGGYISFVSQETGPWEIYIRPYPGPGGQVTVSLAADANRCGQLMANCFIGA